MKKGRGTGCFFLPGGIICLVILSFIFPRFNLGQTVLFFIVTLLITFAVLNIIYESKSGQYDPLRDLWFTAIAIIFLIVSYVVVQDRFSSTLGVSLGTMAGLLTFVYRPEEMKQASMQLLSSEKISQIKTNAKLDKKKVVSFPLILTKEEVIARGEKSRLRRLVPAKKIDRVELFMHPYYLIRCQVESEGGFAIRGNKNKRTWEIQVVIDLKTNDIFELEEEFALEELEVKADCLDEHTVDKEKALKRAKKFASYQVSPSKHRTIPDVTNSEIKPVYRPYWLVIFEDGKHSLFAADNLQAVRRK